MLPQPTSLKASRSARLIQLRRVYAGMLTALVSVSGADPSGSLKARPGSANTNAARRQPFPDARFIFEPGDVLAFVGGADVEAAQHTGHLEGASVIALQFGRSEAMNGRIGLAGFVSDYQKLLDECARQTPRLMLVTPPPFEKGGGWLPDLSARNSDLAEYANAIRSLARQRNLTLVDLFAELGGASHREPRLTDDGLQLTPGGQAHLARAFARQLGFGKVADAAGVADQQGVWPNAAFERLRQVVVTKNRLWFNYWRPQNWAFLGGDRTAQPSSRDYRNPTIRWFPAEMERFVPLIEAEERQIAELANKLP